MTRVVWRPPIQRPRLTANASSHSSSTAVAEADVQRLDLFERQRNTERRQVGVQARVVTRELVLGCRLPRLVLQHPQRRHESRIQRALRASLNRRVTRRPPVFPTATPTTTPRQRAANGSSPTSSLTEPTKCSARIEALAQPRPHPSKRPVVPPVPSHRPFRGGTGASPTLLPRPAWL